MSVSIRRETGALLATTDTVELRIDLDLLCADLRARDGSVEITGFGPRAATGHGVLAPGASRSSDDAEVGSVLGRSRRIELEAPSLAGDATFRWCFELPLEGPGLCIGLAVEASGERLRSPTLQPFVWPARPRARLRIEGGRALECFELGFQSRSPGGTSRLTRPRVPRRAARLPPFAPAGAPRETRRRRVSHGVLSLQAPGERGLALGFVRHERLLSYVELEHRGRRVSAVRASACGTDSHSQTEPLWLGLPDATQDGAALWAGRASRAMNARPLATRSTWEPEALRDPAGFEGGLVEVRSGRLPVDEIRLAVDGLPPEVLCERLERAARAGVTLAARTNPLRTPANGSLSRTRTDWLLMDPLGQPWRVGDAGESFVLDSQHPDVRTHLRERARSLVDAGFQTLALEGLAEAALLPCKGESGVESYRSALRALREGAGERARLVGLDAPICASLGLLDAIALDPARLGWRDRLAARLGAPTPAWPDSVGLIGLLTQGAIAGKLFALESPPLPLAGEADGVDRAELESWLGTAVLAATGPVLRGSVGPGTGLVARLLPSAAAPGGRARAGGPVHLFLRASPDGSRLLLALNPGRRARRATLELAALGLDRPVHVFDPIRGTFGRPAMDELELELEGSGSRLLRLSPVDATPRLIGSTLHLSGGELEQRALARAGAGVRLALELRGARSGRVSVETGESRVAYARVGFRDAIELELEEDVLLPDASLLDSAGSEGKMPTADGDVPVE